MKTPTFCVFLIASVLNSLLGESAKLPETLKLEDGTIYKNVRLISQTPSEIVIFHSGGAKNIKKVNLSLKHQRALNFSQEVATAYNKDVAETQRERREEAIEREKIREEELALKKHIKENTFMLRGKIQQIIPDGILLELQESSNQSYYGVKLSLSEEKSPFRYRRYTKPRPRRGLGWLFLTQHPEQAKFSDGQLIDVDAYQDGIQAVGKITAKRFVYLRKFE